QPDSGVPLLINNDGDAECDALATAPGGVALPSLKLKAVKPAGKAFFPNDSSQQSIWPPLTGCVLGNETNPPAKLCNGASDLTMAIEHDAAGEPVIYGIGEMLGLECTGGGWEIASQLANAT